MNIEKTTHTKKYTQNFKLSILMFINNKVFFMYNFKNGVSVQVNVRVILVKQVKQISYFNLLCTCG